MEKIAQIRINTEYITLGQFLKYVGLIDVGSEARFFLSENIVRVDGVEETRRGRKLRGGEKVEAQGKTFEITR